jgi:hypothetical protein
MSQVSLLAVKQALRQTHDEDDDLLARLIQSAERECRNFLGMDALPMVPDEDNPSINVLPPDIENGIILMVQADYDGDPLMRDKLRAAAEALWMPYAERDRTWL